MRGLQRIHNYFSTDPVEFARQVQEFERNVEEALKARFTTGRFIPGSETDSGDSIPLIVEQEGEDSQSTETKTAPAGSGFYLIGFEYSGRKGLTGEVIIAVDDTEGNELFVGSTNVPNGSGDLRVIASTHLVLVRGSGFRFRHALGGTLTTENPGHWFALKVSG